MTDYTSLFRKRLEYTREHSPWYSPPSQKLLDTLTPADDASLTPSQVGSRALLMGNHVATNNNVGYTELEKLGGAAKDHTCFQFGQGQQGWYFLYGNVGTAGFTFMLHRIDVAPGAVLAAQSATAASSALYGIVAGCGARDGPWYTLPHTVVPGTYTCDASTGALDFRATTAATGDALQSCSFTSAGAAAGFVLSLSWLDPATAQAVSVDMTLVPAASVEADGDYNGEGGCYPVCLYGLGSLYWSYTRPAVTATVRTPASPSAAVDAVGTGWFDSQWFNNGLLYGSWFYQVLTGVSQSLSSTEPTRWTWLTLQLDDGYNYMLATFVPGQLQTGETTHVNVANRYNPDGTVDLGVKGIDTTVTATTVIDGVTYPTRYTVSFVGDDEAPSTSAHRNVHTGSSYTLAAGFGDGIVILPNGTANWESPGFVLDEAGTASKGTGFLEANQFQVTSDLVRQAAAAAGLTEAEGELFVDNRRGSGFWIWPLVAVFVALVLVTLPVVLLVRAARRDRHGKRRGEPRTQPQAAAQPPTGQAAPSVAPPQSSKQVPAGPGS